MARNEGRNVGVNLTDIFAKLGEHLAQSIASAEAVANRTSEEAEEDASVAIKGAVEAFKQVNDASGIVMVAVPYGSNSIAGHSAIGGNHRLAALLFAEHASAIACNLFSWRGRVKLALRILFPSKAVRSGGEAMITERVSEKPTDQKSDSLDRRNPSA